MTRPTLSNPFATCGEWSFTCGEWPYFQTPQNKAILDKSNTKWMAQDEKFVKSLCLDRKE